MNIPNAPLRPMQNPEGIGADSLGFDLGNTDINEALDDELKDAEEAASKNSEESETIKRRKKQKRHSSKSTEMGLLKQEISNKEVLEEFAKKAAEKNTSKYKEALTKKFKQEYNEYLKDAAQDHSQALYKDVYNVTEKARKDTENIIKTNKAVHNTQEKISGKETKISEEAINEKLKTSKKETETFVKKHHTTQIKNQAETQNKMRHFMTLFSESQIKNDPKKKRHMQTIKKELLAAGVPTSTLHSLERNVQSLILKDLKKELKNRFIETCFHYKDSNMTLEIMSSYKQFKEMENVSKELGLFGEGRASKETVKNEAKEEIRDYIKHELDQKLIETKLRTESPKALLQAFDSFNQLASFSRFNAGEFLKNFHKKLDDFGLNHFVSPDKKGVLDYDSDDNSKKKDPHTIQELDADTADEDTLKRLYVKQYLVSGIQETLSLKWDIFKAENRLKKQGKTEKIEALKNELSHTAKLKLTFMLRDVFEERATLVELSGPKYNLKIGRAHV